jgi:serine/threonine protein kinase
MQVLLGLPFTSAIDMFSLGLILAEYLLSPPDPSSPPTQHGDPSFPSSPPQSHSPQPVDNLPLLATNTSSRQSYIEKMIDLFGPLPQSFRAGKFWNDNVSQGTVGQNETLLIQRLEDEGVDPELIDFIMRMLNLEPERRISARDALKHEWLVGPLLGYWAALGVEWVPLEKRDQVWQRPVEKQLRRESLESSSSVPENHTPPDLARKLPPLYDFSAMQDDEDEADEVSFVHTVSSPTKSLPPNSLRTSPFVEADEQVPIL